jgi:DNA repair exonuclease SbcCD ATPase subunit
MGCIGWLERLIKLPKQVAEMDTEILKEIERNTLEKWLKDIEKIEGEYETYRRVCGTDKTLENYINLAKSKLLSILNPKIDYISWLERLIKLPKQIATKDLGQLMGNVDEHIRRQWWDEIKRIQQEYYMKYMPECGKDDYLAGYISLAQLKLVLSFKMKNERVPEHNFDEKLLDLIASIEKDIQHVRTWDVKRLASYYVNMIRRGEAGFFKLIKEIVEKGLDPLEEIVKIPYIPVPLAKVICRVYENEIEKMKEAAIEIIRNPIYGPTGIYTELNQEIEKAKKKREEVERKLDYEYERRLQEIYERLKSIESEKANVEKRLIRLEKELARKEKDIQMLEHERRELEENYREIINRYETALKEQERTIKELKREIEKLEDVKRELIRVKAEQAKTEEEKRRIEEELRKIVSLYNSIREEIENIAREGKELKSKKNEIEAIIKALKEEDVFFDGITSEQARLMEIDYTKIVESRLKEMNGWKVTISDEREKIYNELKALDGSITYDSLSKIPNNIIITATKGWFKKRTFQVRILSHYKELYFAGVDKRKFTLAEIMPFIEELKGKDDRFVLALASTTGWSDKAIDYVKKTPYNLILIDLRTKNFYYNPAKIELEDYIYYIRSP